MRRQPESERRVDVLFRKLVQSRQPKQDAKGRDVGRFRQVTANEAIEGGK